MRAVYRQSFSWWSVVAYLKQMCQTVKTRIRNSVLKLDSICNNNWILIAIFSNQVLLKFAIGNLRSIEILLPLLGTKCVVNVGKVVMITILW